MSMIRRAAIAAVTVTTAAAAAGVAMAGPAAASAHARTTFLGRLHQIRNVASTVPGNGDVNPYGMAVIRRSVGRLHRGDILISNFNNSKNLQGTGSTIVQISPGGHRTVFANVAGSKMARSCPGGIGLTTALVVLRHGWVVVGSTPSKDGTAKTSGAGCLIMLNRDGRVREVLVGIGSDGPWDATAVSQGRTADLFFTNVLNGTVAGHGRVVRRGTVIRMRFRVSRSRPPLLTNTAVIGSRFAERTDPAAFVIGPTGLGLGRNGTLYVADSASNRITAISRAMTRHSSAGTGTVVTSGRALATPLGLALAPNGHILTVNAANGLIVETTPAGAQVARRLLDGSGSPPGSGALFGLVVAPHGRGVYYVDDATNMLRLLH